MNEQATFLTFSEPEEKPKIRAISTDPSPQERKMLPAEFPKSEQAGKILTIRGTSGSGKSYLARKIMERFNGKEALFIEGRKNPICYRFKHPEGGSDFCVIGSYESACGGCDTILDGRFSMGLVSRLSAAGFDVLYEGLFLSGDVKWIKELSELPHKPKCHALYIDISVEECIASVNARRLARGQEKPVKEKNTRAKHKCVMRSLERLRGEAPAIESLLLKREELVQKAFEILSLSDSN